MKLVHGGSLAEEGRHDLFEGRVLCVAKPGMLEEPVPPSQGPRTGQSERKLAIAAMMLGSRLAGPGTSLLTKLEMST